MLFRHLLLAALIPLLAACPPTNRRGDDDDSASDDDDTVSNDDDAAGAVAVEFDTTMGAFTIEFYEEESPITVANFLTYVDEGHFDGTDGEGTTQFHRIIDGFVVQGGGVDEFGSLKDTHDPIVNEAISSGLSNTRGSVAMARTSVPDSATSGFYVNLEDNLFLNPGESTAEGYAVFGEVVDGMDVIDAMGSVATDGNDQPLELVLVNSVTRL
ncbi:MAG: peptidyl-prolyl cis-trans isomerase [Proteobacteria bacterium]|nr:peptidyl-prolyl cis-trans isomerase [Pseudomonadota bacterium]